MTAASNKLARAQEVSAAKGARSAVPLYIEAADALAAERRFDEATSVLLELLNLREKKRSLFGSKETNPLGPDRAVVAKRFAHATRLAAVNDAILELLASLAAEFPDDAKIRFANAEALYRSAYIADAIDEYRYCEQLQPDDGSLTARLGELYAMLSRNAEAIDHLRRGISRLREQEKFDGLALFCLKLVEVAPDAANDVHAWLQDLPEDLFTAQRDDVTKILDVVRERGVDDGRWSDVEARLGALPQAPPAAAPALAATPSERSWDDGSTYEPVSEEPVSEDEMRLLLGPAPATKEFAEASGNGVSHEPQEPEQEEQPAPTQGLRISTGRAQATSALDARESDDARESALPQERPASPTATPPAPAAPTAAAALPPGLAAYTRRKGDGLLATSEYQGAAQCYERLLKAGFEPDLASLLLECYIQLGRFQDAARIGLQLADHQAAAGELDRAVETLSKILEHSPDPDVEQRRSELLTAAQG